jgi:hypothetical protein
MVCDGVPYWKWLTQWLFDLNWVLVWHSFLGCWSSFDNLGEVLHDGRMNGVACLENALLRGGAFCILEESITP